MFNVFQSANETGVFTIDKVGDAIKEMTIKMNECDEDVADVFKSMGYNSDEMFKKFGEGGDSAKEVFLKMTEGLSNIEDPIKRNQAAVTLFGTMAEDLGIDAVEALGGIEGAFDQTYESAEQLTRVRYDSLSDAFEGLKRAIDVNIFQKIGESITNFFDPLLDIIPEIVASMSEWGQANEGLLTAIGLVGGAVGGVLVVLGALATTVGTIAALVAGFNALIVPLLPLIGSVATVLGVVSGAAIALGLAIKENWDGIRDATSQLVEECSPYFDDLKGAFSRLWETAKSIWETVGQPLFRILGEVIEVAILNAIPFIKLLLSTFTSAIDAISLVWNTVGKPVFGFIVSVVQTMWAAVKPLLTALANVFSSVMNVVQSAYRNLFKPAMEGLSKAVGSMWSSVKSKLNSFKNGVSNVMKTVLSPVKEVIKWFDKLANTVGKISKTVVGKVQAMFGRSRDFDINAGVEVAAVEPLSTVAMSGSYYTRSTPLATTYGELSNTLQSVNGYMTSGSSSNIEGMFKKMLDLMTLQTQLLENNQEVIVNVGGTELKKDFYNYTVKKLNMQSKLAKGF